MKKLVTFAMIALIVAIGLTIATPSSGFTAPKDGTVRVWVEFQPGKKGATQSALKGSGAQFHYTFDELNSFVVTLPAAALQGISRNPNVVSIEEDAPRYLFSEDVPYGIDMVQARDVWDVDLDGVVDAGAVTGSGVTVCIIDSGLKTSHEDFAGADIVGGYPDDGDGEDYVWYEDTCGHGTHVAGTIAAADNETGVIGVAPSGISIGPSLYIVKVFDGPLCEWAYSSTLVNAANECEQAGADIISMSLGGTGSNRKEQRTFDNLYSQGVLSIAAAGNDGNTSYSYPASYDSVMSVAAIDENMVIADFSQQNDQVEISAPGVGVMSTVPWVAEADLEVNGSNYEANAIDLAYGGVATGNLVDGGLCDSSGNWSGDVVLCERGDISFYDKVMNVQNGGGVAAVIYNNEEGNFLGTMGEIVEGVIPAVSISQADGITLVSSHLGESAAVTASIDYAQDGYEAWDGTSMATPHVSGVAALVWSANPDRSNAEIRSAMTETAVDLGSAGRDNVYGYGLVQAADAIAYLGGGPVNEAPIVTISSPADGATFDSGTSISFAGSASDNEDGDLSAGLVWTSNIDGEIGFGASFSTGLSNGDHTITASVEDSGGKTGSASINITVGTAQQGVMSVAEILMSSTRRGRNYTITTVVVIQDENGYPVSGATVYVNTNGVTSSGVTGSDGRVTFSLSTRNPDDSYTSTVTDVVHDDYIWDGIEASATLPMP